MIARCGRLLLIGMLVLLGLGLPAPAAARAAAVAAPVATLALSTVGAGGVSANPPGPTYTPGTTVTLTATPNAGNLFVGWRIDGAEGGWATPRKIVMDADHTVVATFAPATPFSDFPANGAESEAIRQISARGIIKGYTADGCAARGLAAPCFGPADTVLRGEIAAMIVRALHWEGINPGGATFSDIGQVAPELQRAIAILAAQGVMQGYGDGRAGPTDPVLRIQVISLITRAMVKAGYWQPATANDPSLYPNIPASSVHRLDLVTFVKNAGAIPDRPQTQPWNDWLAPAPRAWTARALWQVLDSYFTSAPFNPNPSNTPPVASADGYATDEDTPLTVAAPGVLGNDSDPNADALTAVLSAGPSHAASFALNANGSFSYTPAANYNGPDSFTYRARDTGGAFSSVATVSLTVNAVNDAPVNGVPGAQNTAANTAVVFSNGNGNAITVADVDLGAGNLQIALTATNGTATLATTSGLSFTVGDGTADATMTFSGTLAAINAALNGLSFAPTAGFTGQASLQIVSNDGGNTGAGGAQSDSDTVTISVNVGPAATIALEANTGSSTVGGARTIQAKVTDGANLAVPGYTVAWAVATGGGSVSAPTSLTDSAGIATITWTLGTTPGAQSATATATGLSGSPVTFPATAVPGPASLTTSTISASPAAIAADGTSTATITVQLKDQYGNNLTGSGGTVALSKTGGGTLSAVTDNGNGTYTATLTAPTSVGSATITGTLDGNTLTDDATVAFVAGAASKYLVTASASSVVAGDTVTITAQLADAGDNPVGTPGLIVTWSSTNGGSFASATSTTNASGIATVVFTTSTVAGTSHTVTADDGTRSGTSGAITTQSGSAAKLAFVQQPSNATAGAAISPAVTVAIRDANGNVVTGATDNVTIALGTNPSSGTLSGTVTVAAVAGVATFSTLSVDKVGTGYTLVASSGSLTGATSNAFNVTAGALDHFLVEAAGGGPIGNQIAGTPFNVRVTAQDAYDNTVTGFVGSVAFSSTPAGGVSGGATSGPFVAGVLSSHGITFGAGGTFTLTATGGGKSGTSNSFDVQAPPIAVDDGPASNASAPGSAFHGLYNQTFSADAMSGLLANDTLGFPAATLASFGGGSLGGAVTSNAAGATVNLAIPGFTGGTLTVGADGGVTLVPPTNFTGTLTFQYRLTNAGGSSDATVTIAVGARPSAVNDSYAPALVGNVPINTATSSNFKVTTNDAGDNVAPTLGTATNGTATIAADGTFTFTPTAGYEGPASFTYTLTNGFGTSAPATVSLTVSGMIWFVNAGAAPGGDGRFGTPFNTLPAFAAVNNGTGNNPAANDSIFLYESGTSYAGPLTLLAGQKLIGQDAAGGDTLPGLAGVAWPADSPAFPVMAPGGTVTTITGAPNGVTLGQNNSLHGFTAGSAAGIAIVGSGFGTLSVKDVAINNPAGAALSLTNGALNGNATFAAFTSVTSGGGTNNVLLSGVTGSLALGSGALAGATGDAFKVDGQNGSFSYSGTITNAATLAVNIANKTGGSVTLSGDINPAAANRGIAVASNGGGTTVTFSGGNKKISTGTGAGVNLTGNTGATVNFTGGGLTIATTTGTGFNATGGGTITVQGSGNTIASSTGIALNVSSTTIGTGGLAFRSISAGTATGSAGNGIVLDNTGSTAGLTVTGTGSAGSGGTIQHKTGADGSTTSGIGIYLNSTSNVSLSWMQLNDFDNFAIHGTSVTGFSLANSVINGLTGTSSGAADAPIAFGRSNPGGANGLAGTNSITDSLIRGGIEHNLEVYSQSNSFTLNVTRTTIRDNTAALGSDGLLMEMQGTGTGTLVVDNCDFIDNKSQAVQVNALVDSAANVTVKNSRVTRTTQGNEGIILQNAANADLTAVVENNVITGIGGTTIFVGQTAGNASSSSNLVATIKGNTVTQTTASNRAIIAFLSTTQGGQPSQANILIDGNSVTAPGLSEPIFVSTPDANTNPAYTATVINNTVTMTDNAGLALRGIAVQATQGTSAALHAAGCFDVRNNTVTYTNGIPAGVNGIRVRQASNGTVQLEQGGSSGTPGAVLAANNPGTGTEIVGTVTVVPNNTCQAPPASATVVATRPLTRGAAADSAGEVAACPLVGKVATPDRAGTHPRAALGFTVGRRREEAVYRA